MNEPKNKTDEFLYSIWNFFAASLSEKTRKNYYNVIKAYIKITGHSPLELTESDTEKYFNDLTEKIQSKRLSYSTALMRMSVMRTLCEYIRVRENNAGRNYINYFKDYILPDENKIITTDKLPCEDDISTILDLSSKAGDDMAYMIFSLVLKCGLTSGEICSMMTNFILYDSNECLCIHFPEKKRISRIIKLPDDVSQMLLTYLEIHKIADGHIFFNKRGTVLKIRDAERLLKKYISQAKKSNNDFPDFTMQDMRHCAFKYMLSGGASEDDVAKYGGITTKWMNRYRQVVNDSAKLYAADYSTISIKPAVYKNLS